MRRHRSEFTAIIAALLLAGLPATAPAADADKTDSGTDTSKVDEAKQQVKSGASQIGHGVKEAAKGVGNTVVEGSKAVGNKIREAANEAKPQAKSAWHNIKEGAVDAGHSVKNFFKRLFGS